MIVCPKLLNGGNNQGHHFVKNNEVEDGMSQVITIVRIWEILFAKELGCRKILSMKELGSLDHKLTGFNFPSGDIGQILEHVFF